MEEQEGYKPQIGSKEIQEALGKLKSKNIETQMNEDYFSGRNPYITQKEPEKKPDNRIPIPMAKMTVEDMAGFAGGIKSEYGLSKADVEDANDKFLEYVRQMEIYNNEQLETSEIYEEALTQGESYELWYTSDEMSFKGGLLTAEYKIIENSATYLKYTSSVKPKLEYAIYYYMDGKDNYADVYYPLIKETWKENDGSYSFIEQSNHPYKQVPINVFPINRKRVSIFQAEKNLIDAFDELISKSLNEVDRFNAQILLMAAETDEGFRSKLNEAGISIIDSLEDSPETAGSLPRYLSKDMGGFSEFYSTLTDRIEQLIRKSTKVVDMTDETFASAQSGVAMAFKMLGMEFKATQIETYFSQGLMRRLDFYVDIYNASSANVKKGEYKITIKPNRNLPIDDKAKAEISRLLEGLISEETLLNYLPRSIVDDTAKEIERKKAEMPSDILGIGEEGDITGTDLDVIADSDVDAIALNGAQVQAAQKIASDVAAGLLPRESGIQLIMALGIPREQAEAIVPAEGKKAE